MTYPPPRHVGDGTPAARLRRADAPPELVFPSGGSASYLATSASTGGDYGLFRWDMGERAGGPDPHLHRAMSFTPGAPRETSFEELAGLDDVARAAMTAADWTALYARHDQVEAHGPPPPR